MAKRASVKRFVDRRLGQRSLVWAGIRGEDIESLSDLSQLSASVAIIAAYRRRGSIKGIAYESLSGIRPDLEIWDIDDHLGEPASLEFRRNLLRLLSRPSALLPYRPSCFLSAIQFVRRDRCINLGLSGAHQAAFDHKPWVESSIRDEGVEGIPWAYVADEEQFATMRQLRDNPVILRRSRTSGGEGIHLIEDPEELAKAWPSSDEGFVSVAPYLSGSIPINVGATVWHDGVTIHYPSVQLIGLKSCVSRPFGYCGNDFGAATELDGSVLDAIQETTRRIGSWLGRFGYCGTFGADYLLHNGKLLFTEVNPRFQGSTYSSARLSVAAGEACLFLEHIAAMLGGDAPQQRPLRSMVSDVPSFAQVIVHWLGQEPSVLNSASLVAALGNLPDTGQIDLAPAREIVVDPGAVVLRASVAGRLTTDGFDLAGKYDRTISDWQAASELS